ncbi:hypothetical protein BJX63DRAFT_278774 [Aspergillus granulosus]|uniref:Uncharacterized protein n=1 Tax=Aspergillus granulosus TaxID=176169 RepID=A0ABR4H7Q4_9EURO
MLQQAIQNVLSTIWVLFASPIAGAITPQGWYGLGAVLAGVEFLLAFFLLPETKYERPLASYQEVTPIMQNNVRRFNWTHEGGRLRLDAACTLDFDTYSPRTWTSDMRLWTGKPNWRQAWDVLQQTFILLLFPNVAWALLLNGLTLGVYIAIGTTYSTIVAGEHYNWPDTSASYVNCGQIVVALLALPLLSHGSDYLTKYRARRNNGIHKPEVRLLPLIFPVVIGVFSIVLYGQAAETPENYHWFIYVWALAAYNFCFVGANITAITYLLDSYPGSVGPILIIICAFRGIISFGTTYSIHRSLRGMGMMALLGFLGH